MRVALPNDLCLIKAIIATRTSLMISLLLFELSGETVVRVNNKSSVSPVMINGL